MYPGNWWPSLFWVSSLTNVTSVVQENHSLYCKRGSLKLGANQCLTFLSSRSRALSPWELEEPHRLMMILHCFRTSVVNMTSVWQKYFNQSLDWTLQIGWVSRWVICIMFPYRWAGEINLLGIQLGVCHQENSIWLYGSGGGTRKIQCGLTHGWLGVTKSIIFQQHKPSSHTSLYSFYDERAPYLWCRAGSFHQHGFLSENKIFTHERLMMMALSEILWQWSCLLGWSCSLCVMVQVGSKTKLQPTNAQE